MKVLLLAGETSGDRHAAGIAQALREQHASVQLRAMGGRALAEAGAELVVDSTRLGVVGLTEVLSILPALVAARNAVRRTIREWRPDVVVSVDYPDFNLRIGRWARRRGVPVVHVVGPQVWAWRPGRLPSIGRSVSRMLVFFPFEVESYVRHAIPVECVGHPLLDQPDAFPDRGMSRRRLGLAREETVVALLPGSRRSEVTRVWPVMSAAVALLARSRADLTFVVAAAPGLPAELFAAPAGGPPLRVAEAMAPSVVAACDVAAVASGTATLETALCGRPLVACYQVSRTTMMLSRWLADSAFLERGVYALPNLVLGQAVVPELYQERFTAEALARSLRTLLEDEAARTRVVTALSGLRARLGGPGAYGRIAAAVLAEART